MNVAKYFPIFIAALVFIVFLIVHYTVPNTPLDREVETVAEEVIKDEVGIDVPLPMDNSTTVVQKT